MRHRAPLHESELMAANWPGARYFIDAWYVVRDDAAVRMPVEFGAAAIGEIEIRNGLNVGDTVVLSDMRDYKDAPSVLIGN